MLRHTRWLSSLAAVCGVFAAGGAVAAEKAETKQAAPGVVRISDRATGIQRTAHTAGSRVKYRFVSPHELMNLAPIHPVGQYRDSGTGGCRNGNCGPAGCGNGQCGDGDGRGSSGCGLFGCSCLKRIWDADVRYKKCKFGYFHPTGCCGKGCPPFGTYDMVYPANPGYFDSRDGRVYAARGTGMPMAVPLAPNVRHTYNYGWGIPSSRRTPISRPAVGGVIVQPARPVESARDRRPVSQRVEKPSLLERLFESNRKRRTSVAGFTPKPFPLMDPERRPGR